MPHWRRHASIDGPIVMIGFGSIGKGTLPLIERHFDYDKDRFVVIDPDGSDRKLLDERGIRLPPSRPSPATTIATSLGKLLTEGGGQGFCVNLSVDTSSLDIMRFCREIGALYIDTVVEPWPGFYFDKTLGTGGALQLRAARDGARRAAREPGGTTAVSCCGANPGMVSWFVKQALINLAADLGVKVDEPKTREDWGRLAQRLGVKGIHIAERDTQRAKSPKPRNVFVNTWSVEGFLSEGMQPAELGWGTHEKWTPANAGFHKTGCGAAIYLEPARRQHPRALVDADRARPVSASSSPTTSRSRSPTTTRCATTRARRSTGRPATTPITPATTRCSPCTSCSAAPARCRRSSTSSARPRSSTASTSSACSSTATSATPIGTARSSRSRRRAPSRPTRTPPACR